MTKMMTGQKDKEKKQLTTTCSKYEGDDDDTVHLEPLEQMEQ